ncbi:MAG: hypothetical protein QXW48_03920 [Thermoplasmata archaeon]
MRVNLWFADSGEVINDFVVLEGNVKIELETNGLLRQFNMSIEELKEKLKKSEQVSLYYDDGTEVILKKV